MYRIYSLLLSFIFFLTACDKKPKNPHSEDFYLQYTDSYGREIVLTQKPKRVVSLSPAITEMIFVMGCENQLVGITDYCTYPPETESIPKVGGIQDFNMESVVLLHPDVVLISSIVAKSDVEKLTLLQIPVIAIKEEENMEGILNTFTFLGKLFDKQSLADSLTKQLKEKLNLLQSEEDDCPKLSVYYVVGFGEAGDYTAPKKSHIHEMITKAGGRNIGENLTGWNVSKEFLFQEDPDIIFVRSENLKQFMTLYPYNELTAVKKGNVYPIESGWIDIVSPRNILAIEKMNEIIKKKKTTEKNF
jgi:iron complex transport system substrate-binding protein